MLVISACSSKKRVRPPPELCAAVLPQGPLWDIAAQWRRRVESASELCSARELYIGRAIAEAKRAGGTKPLLIISAGLGLVHEDDLIPSYDLTISPGSDASIRRKVFEFDATEWWRAVSGSNAPIATAIRGSQGPVLICASSAYLEMITADISSLGSEDRERLRIATRGRLPAATSAFLDYVLPYDERLDGPDSLLRGTTADFASRAGRDFVEHVIPVVGEAADVTCHRNAVLERLAPMRRPTVPIRRRCTDQEVIGLIKRNWRKADGQSSRMLRLLRHELGVACEQGRFRGLFLQAQSEQAQS